MSTDLVVQLGARLDQFAADMNQAGDMADAAVSRVEQSFANLNPNFGGFGALGAAAAGALGGVTGLIAALASVNSELANISEASKYLNTTTDQVQKLQYAASSIGIGGSDAIKNLENVGKLLNDSLVNENSLTKLLDQNGIQYKDQSGKLITINQLLSAGADLVKNSGTYADKSVIANMLGLTKEWVPLLDQGASGFNQIANSAQDAGAIIDSETIQRAAEFDKQWKNSTESFSTYMKSALVDLLPFFDDLIERAAKLIKNLPGRADIQAAADAQLKQLGDAAGAPDSVAITVNTDNLHTAIQEWQNSPVFEVSTWTKFGEALGAAIRGQSPEEAAKTIPGYAASQITEPTYPTEAQMNSAFSKQAAAENAAQDAEQDKELGVTSTKIPSKTDNSGTADAYDRAQQSLIKFTNSTEAQAKVQGQSNAEMEEAKANADLLTAAQKAGLPITDKLKNEIQDLAQDAGLAAEALAKAKVASDIEFSSKTAFLTPQDLAIAQQLKSIYGNDIPAAMASSEAASLRFNDTIKQLGQLGQQVNSGFLVDFETQIRNGASAMDALKTAGLNALGKIADKLAQMAADNLWSSAFGGSGGLNLASLFGSGSKSPTTVSDLGAGTGGLSYPAFASGTDYAPGGMSLVGENGPELLNIPKGSQVIPNDILRNGGGGGVTVNAGSSIVIQGNADSQTLSLLKAELARRDAQLPGQIVATVRDAKARRVLA